MPQTERLPSHHVHGEVSCDAGEHSSLEQLEYLCPRARCQPSLKGAATPGPGASVDKIRERIMIAKGRTTVADERVQHCAWQWVQSLTTLTQPPGLSTQDGSKAARADRRMVAFGSGISSRHRPRLVC